MTFDSISIVWPMMAGVCLAVGLIRVIAWQLLAGNRAHLAQGISTLGLAALFLFELSMLSAWPPGELGINMRWTILPMLAAVVLIVAYVRSYLRADQLRPSHLWGWCSICSLGLLVLILSFQFEPNPSYGAIPGRQHTDMSAGLGSPWASINELSSLVLVLFIAYAALKAWCIGGRVERRRAMLVGGSLAFLLVVALASSTLLPAVNIRSLFLISTSFLAIVTAFSFELGPAVLRSVHRATLHQEGKADLRQYQRRMEQAADAAKLGLLEWDIGRDEISVSDQGRALFGFAKVERIDFNRYLEVLHPDDSDFVRETVTRSLENRTSYECEFRVRLPAGGVRWIATRGYFDLDAKGCASLMRIFSFDITRLKQTEECFHQAAEIAPFGIIIVNPRREITLANASIEMCFGYPRRELLGQAIDVLIPEFAEIRPANADGNFWRDSSPLPPQTNYKASGRRKDGSEIPLEIDLVSIPGSEGMSVLVSVINIGDRKQRDDVLWKERAFFWQVIDINPSLIFAKDRQGRYVLANQAVADLYGTTVRSLIGKTDADLNRNVEEVQSFYRADLEVLATLQARFIAEEQVTDAAGKRRWLQVVKQPMLDQDGTASHILGSATDITARKLAELELERQRNELAHLSRVTMLSELSGSLAHELNQPLTAILSNAQAALRFLSHADPNIDEVREILRDIVDDDKRAGEVIQGLRLLLKKGEMRYEPVDLNVVLSDVLKLMRSDLLNAEVRLAVKLAPSLPSVSGARVQLLQVLLNLLVNGCEAMADCRVADRQMLVCTACIDDKYVRVCVADQGRGIPASDLERVFEPFFTTKVNGLGLGLAVCRQIISAHGGRLWATNNVGRGTTFCIELPAITGEAE